MFLLRKFGNYFLFVDADCLLVKKEKKTKTILPPKWKKASHPVTGTILKTQKTKSDRRRHQARQKDKDQSPQTITLPFLILLRNCTIAVA